MTNQNHHYRVIANNLVLGVANTDTECRRIIAMRRTGKGASTQLDYKVEVVSGEYPYRDWKAPELNYTPGHYGAK